MEPGGAGGASPNMNSSGSIAGSGNGIGVRVAIIPTLLHRTPIQILFLDIKNIIRELYRIIPNHGIAQWQSVAPQLAPPSTSQTSKSKPVG